MEKVMAMLAEATLVPHQYTDDTDQLVSGQVLHALDVGGKLYLVVRDDDSTTPRNVVAPMTYWSDLENLMEGLPPLPVMTINELDARGLAKALTYTPPSLNQLCLMPTPIAEVRS